MRKPVFISFTLMGLIWSGVAVGWQLDFANDVEMPEDLLRYHTVNEAVKLELSNGNSLRFITASVQPNTEKANSWHHDVVRGGAVSGAVRSDKVWSFHDSSVEDVRSTFVAGSGLPGGRHGGNYWGCLDEKPLFKLNFDSISNSEPSPELVFLVTGRGGESWNSPMQAIDEEMTIEIFDARLKPIAKVPLMAVNIGSFRQAIGQEGMFAHRAYSRQDWPTQRAKELGLGAGVFTKLFFFDGERAGVLLWTKRVEAVVFDRKLHHSEKRDERFLLAEESFLLIEREDERWHANELGRYEAKSRLAEKQLNWASGYPQDNTLCENATWSRKPLSALEWVE